MHGFYPLGRRALSTVRVQDRRLFSVIGTTNMARTKRRCHRGQNDVGSSGMYLQDRRYATFNLVDKKS